MNTYNGDGDVVFATNQVEVGEEQEYEVVIGSDETSPCGYVLSKS